MMHAYAFIAVVLAVVLAAVYVYQNSTKKKETWFSRDLNYGKANAIMWDATVKKGLEGIRAANRDIKKKYPYPGYGDYTGFICQGPNNEGCTSYTNYEL